MVQIGDSKPVVSPDDVTLKDAGATGKNEMIVHAGALRLTGVNRTVAGVETPFEIDTWSSERQWSI